jgi:methyl-accepting chemotaxis protein
MHAAPATYALFQVPTYAMSDGQFHTLLWFTGLIAFWLFLQAVALVAVAFMVVKLLKTINEFATRMEAKALAITDRFEGKMYPLVDNFQDLMNDTVPKIKRVTESVADTTDVYRAKLAQVDALITDTAAKAKKQSDRVDGMVTSTLNAAGSIVGRVEHAVLTPVKQATAIFSGLRAAATKLADEYAQPDARVERAPYAEAYERSRATGAATPRPVAFEGEQIHTGLQDDYHA